MKVNVYTPKGTKLKTGLELNSNTFGVKGNQKLLAHYVRVFLSNQRVGTASVKTRGEVSGGGRKPWRQKGTGRARHGSIRSPLWVGGGKAHGPKSKDWRLALPKKMKRKALLVALSEKATAGRLFVLSQLSFKELKTREVVFLLGKLPLKGKTLLILGEGERDVFRAARNIAGLSVRPLGELNAYEVLRARNFLASRSTVLALQEFFGGGGKK